MKYLITGEQVRVIENLASGVLVEVCLEAYDEEGREVEAYSPPRIVDRVYDTAPREKLDAHVAAAQKQLTELQSEIRASLSKLPAAQREHDARMKELAKYEPLKHLEEFLAGKITHYLLLSGWGLMRIEEQPPEQRGYAYTEQKLLCLFGRSGGSLTWRMNDYYDGSGSWTTALPFTSLDEARAEAQRRVDGWELEGDDGSKERLFKAAVSLKLSVPDGLRALASSLQRARAQSVVDNCQKQLAEAQSKLHAALAESGAA